MKRKKVCTALSLCLSTCVGLSPIQSLAVDNVVETQTVTTDAQTNVTINGAESSFTVTVPKLITGTGDSGSLDYTVEVEGDIAGDKRVFAEPDSTVALKQDKKQDILANISQNKTSWVANELDIVGNGLIEYSGLSAGTWQGNFNFNVGIKTDSYIPVSVIDSNGEDLNASASLITGEKADELLSKLVESGNINSVDDVDLLVDIQTDSFEDISTATFDVSSIASEGEKVAILHYNETTSEWEYIGIETVDSAGKISGDFTSYSPIAFVKVTKEGNLGEVTQRVWEAGLYDEYGNLLCSLNKYDVNCSAYVTNLPEAKKIDTEKVVRAIIPEGVTSIPDYAFTDCVNLQFVTLPESLYGIGYKAFKNCINLSSIQIPTNVGFIRYNSFYGCYSLKSIQVSSENTTYDSRNNCNAVITTASNSLVIGSKNTVIPDSVTSIDTAFYGCTGLTSINIPDSVTSIATSAFNNCTNLAKITVSSGNTVYDSRENCNGIIKTETNTLIKGCKNTTIPDSVTSIGARAFEGCTGLTLITIPESVTSIGASAFEGCTGLALLTIPESVTSIDTGAFNNVQEIYCLGDVSQGYPWGALKATSTYTPGLYDANDNLLAPLTTEQVNGISDIPVKLGLDKDSVYKAILPKGTIRIGELAFENCSNLTSVTIPNSVLRIGQSAFYECTNLTSVVIPDSVTKIDSNLFMNCTSLTSVTIPNSVTSIGDRAFNGCTSLTSITIPDSVKEIGYNTFQGCTSLTSVTIPGSVTLIYKGAFGSCINLASVTIPDSVTSIGEDAFYKVPHIYYNGTATGSPWGAKAIN